MSIWQPDRNGEDVTGGGGGGEWNMHLAVVGQDERYGKLKSGRLGVVALLYGELQNVREYHVLGRFGLTVSSTSGIRRAAAYESGTELAVEIPLSAEWALHEEQFDVSFETFTNSHGPHVSGLIVILDAESEVHLAGPVNFSITTYGEEIICSLKVSDGMVHLFPKEDPLDARMQLYVDLVSVSPKADCAHFDEYTPVEKPVEDQVDVSVGEFCDELLEDNLLATKDENFLWNREESFSQLILSVSDKEASKKLLKQKLTHLTTKLKQSSKNAYADMVVDDLLPFFGMTREELAKRTGICLTLLKKIVRKVGIIRWPCRKYRQWQRKAELIMCKYQAQVRVAKTKKNLDDYEDLYNTQMDKLKRKFFADIGSLINT